MGTARQKGNAAQAWAQARWPAATRMAKRARCSYKAWASSGLKRSKKGKAPGSAPKTRRTRAPTAPVPKSTMPPAYLVATRACISYFKCYKNMALVAKEDPMPQQSLRPLPPQVLELPIRQAATLRPGLRVVDVREDEERAREPLPFAADEAVPLHGLLQRAQAWATDEPLAFVCRGGARSWAAARLLAAQGFTQVVHLSGGLMALRNAR